MSTVTDPAAVLQFWFGADGPAATVAARQATLWWSKDAADNRLDDWADTPTGLLALILLLDQFPRAMYRDTADAFAFDELARQCCHLGLAQGFDQQLSPLQRVFLYLPLEHSEDIDDQEYSLQLFRALARQSAADDPDSRAAFAGFLGYAERHHAIIARLNRFPHRNHVLGRASTKEEAAFLQEPHSSF